MQDTQRITSDLNWLYSSPSFLSTTAIQRQHQVVLRDAASLLEHAPLAAEDFVLEPTHRLGVYFEQLWHYLIRQQPKSQLVAHNQQVIIDKQTLGEFDSLIKELPADELIHCELAVKFYLQIGSGERLADWVGPNLRDRFDVKFERLLNHQLALSALPEVKSWLQERRWSIGERALLTRGRLFYPYSQFVAQQRCFPSVVEPQHLTGFWLQHRAFHKLQAEMGADYQWFVLPRLYWLAEVSTSDLPQLRPIDTLTADSLCQVVAIHKGREVMRGFVVTDEWLERAQQRIRTAA